jgi:hypothetical protein
MTDKKITDEEISELITRLAKDAKTDADRHEGDPDIEKMRRDRDVLVVAMIQFAALLAGEDYRVTNQDITAWFEDYIHDIDDRILEGAPDCDREMHKRAVLVAAAERFRVPLTSSDGKEIDPDCFVKLREIACISRATVRSGLERIEKSKDPEFINLYKHMVAYETAFSQAYRESYATVRGITPTEAEAEIRAAEKQEGKQNEGD